MSRTKPSKSERKRQQLELQRLGEELVLLDPSLLDELPLTERLRDAIASLGPMKSHEARRRQRQYIGKLMREIDPEPIHRLLDRLRADDRREKRLFATAERWRDRLVHDGEPALDELVADLGLDPTRLASLLADLRHAFSDRDTQRIRRELFREIHAALAARAPDVRIS